MDATVRCAVRVEGVVQGVGFRPFVHGLAQRYGLSGRVGNDTAGVFIDAEGRSAAVQAFLGALETEAPRLAAIERVSVTEAQPCGQREFRIVASDPGGAHRTLVSADSATCDDCLAELFDPRDRRYGYAFINCTNCGPRFTIVRDVPYDRPLTTMAGFDLCRRCAAEYHDPADRRFHAQPVCCPECGPRLRLLDAAAAELDGDPIEQTGELLNDGRIVAVKGLGGYHLACDATDPSASAALRGRKHREDKPFAVMVPSVQDAASLCVVDTAAERLLTGRRRPIVLLERRRDTSIAGPVAPGNRHLGVMLPYTPLHHLLLAHFGKPLVLTSGNVSDEPICFRDEEAIAGLGDIADAFLTHDRPIHMRTDDSVVRPWRGTEMTVRRSRGYVPEPITLPAPLPRPVLGCGAELKNTFCLADGVHAFCSHHIGDLENYETLRSFTDGIEHFERLFDIAPRVLAHDLHPEYLATKYALERSDVELVGVQHHHAHIAACLADNHEQGPVIGVAFDGTGYGSDATLWGGEFLVADLRRFHRAAHLEPLPLPGGDTAVRQPWRMAVSYLDAANHLDADGYPDIGGGASRLPAYQRHAGQWPHVVGMSRRRVNAPVTSSAGRLCDAVAALLDVRDEVNYEGQAAIELEQLADPAEPGGYPVAISEGDPILVSGSDLVAAVLADLRTGTDRRRVAARFHNTLAETVVAVCTRLAESHGLRTVALSGGVFQNMLLLHRTVERLTEHGLRVLTHSRVPCNDGGISLGQVAVAGARERRMD